jgi:hypothetical protein
MTYVVYERSRCNVNALSDPLMRPHESTHFVPSGQACPREIETSGTVLLDGRTFGQDRVKLSVVAKHDPTLCCNLGQPFVIRRFLSEFELAARVVVILDRKWRARCPDSFRKALPKVPIKVVRQCN